MPRDVEITPGYIVTFPDSMSDADVDAASARLYSESRYKAGAASPVPLVSAGGRGTRLNVRRSDEFGQGGLSVVPFSGVERPDTLGGYLGQGAAYAALLAHPLMRVAGAGIAEGLPLASRALGAGKELLSQAEPVVKYEVIKGGLEHIGMPAPLAMGTAMLLSGYRKGAKARSAVAAAEAEPAAAAATRPAAAAAAAPTAAPVAPPAAAPVAAPAPPRLSPQMVRNQVGVAEKRAGLALTERQRAAADTLVRNGADPMKAVQWADRAIAVELSKLLP